MLIEDILNNIRETDDCRYVVFGVNKEKVLEYYKCYTYLQYKEIITDMKNEGYKKVRLFKVR